ncbi:hypothetical protein I317_04236 [Kwoniella heveanensis CBS 569]|uniref:Uncharacterized protein n=1 Tax=Kwoniella heveanensis BCC8398 TaxID=1296120 RepID=A0A1B9GWY2_9TREE|nr:hypothetical protein I316_02582 [Kwoniella heveanensis BCC8398]OCF41934.1 hypothetical protein I317_04236 [Kwoniella heveanensis CBS 569]
MRFSTLFLALPLALIGSAFAAPAPAPVASPFVDGTTDLALEKRDVDILQTVQQLQNTVAGCSAFGPAQTEIEVEATLEIIVGALEQCGNTLGIDLSLGVDVDVTIGAIIAQHGNIKQQVADILVQVIVDINVIVKSIKPAICQKPKCAALLARIDVCLTLILKGLNTLIAGLIFLVGTLLIGLGIVLTGFLGSLLALLGGILGSILGCLLGWCH